MPVPRRLPALLAIPILLVGGLLAGCQGEPDPGPTPPEPLRPEWRQVAVPAPEGEPGRLMLRDVVACAGRWFLVGGVAGADGATRPAAWISTDGQNWTSLRFEADSYYGRQNVIYSAGCRDGRLAALGAKTGGAHAYPRTSSWWQRSDGHLVEVSARFELYGGPTAVNVGRLVGGPAGWLIVGNRSSGAAAWVSPDSADFELLEGAPELATDDRGVTWAFDAVAGPAGGGAAAGWLMVGGVLPRGRIDRDPAGWTSPDGRIWARLPMPATEEYEELQRVALVGAIPVGVGLRGRTFGAWRGGHDGWLAVGGFGATGGTGLVAGVSGLTVAAGHWLLATTSDGTAHGLWASPNQGISWRPVIAPVPMPAGVDRDAGLLAVDDRLVLFTDGGKGDAGGAGTGGVTAGGSTLWLAESAL